MNCKALKAEFRDPMRALAAFTCALVVLHLVSALEEISQHDVLMVRQKWADINEMQILPQMNLSTVLVKNNVCVRLCLRMEPLPANKTILIEFTEQNIKYSYSFLIKRSRHKKNTLRWNQRKRVKIRNQLTSTENHLDRKPVWELQYDCFMAQVGSRVHVAVFAFNRTLAADSYVINQPGDPVPVYNVTVDIVAKRFLVAMEEGKNVSMRLCYKNVEAICQRITSHVIDTDLEPTVNLSLPYLVPCVCVEMYYPGVDTRRNTTCPLKDKFLPVAGGGDVLSSSSVQLYGSSVLLWKPLCPSAQFKPTVSLCWQHHTNHSLCFSLQNTTLHEQDLKYNVSDVDKHAHMCVEFSLNGTCRVFCPFSTGNFSSWDVTVVLGFRRMHVTLSSSVQASFSAQLCVEEGVPCVLTGSVHSAQMEDCASGVQLTVPIPFLISGLCVQVWRSEPFLMGRRIICPDYTHRRWGLIAAVSLVILVIVTTLAILIHALIKRKTSVWRSAERKPVLLVCSSDDSSHVSAVCTLASGLEEELRMDVRLAQWAHCSSQASLANLGPVPWLYGQCQRVQQAGGMVLVAWGSEAQQAFMKWKKKEGRGKVGKEQKDGVLFEENVELKWTESQNSITAPVFNATLVSLWAGLHSESRGQGFGLVFFQGLSGTCYIPKELRGIPRYCLPRDLSNLIHDLDLKGCRPGGGVEDLIGGGCCWPRLFSKALAFWLSQRLARRLHTWLPQTATETYKKLLPKPAGKTKGEKELKKKTKRNKLKKRKDCLSCKAGTKSVQYKDTEKELMA